MNSTVKGKKLKSKTDWNKVKSLSEEQINKAAKSDPDAVPRSKAQLKKFKPINKNSAIDVEKIRNKLHLSQEQFADIFGFNIRTVREWEQHRRNPSGPARQLLMVIMKEPKAVMRALGHDKH